MRTDPAGLSVVCANTARGSQIATMAATDAGAVCIKVHDNAGVYRQCLRSVSVM